MARSVLLFSLLGVFSAGGLSACGNPPTGSDAGGGDAGPGCSEPDRVCPEDPPLDGSPCEGMLSCPIAGGIATCAGGLWSFDPGCDGGCAPPLAEICRTPFTGTLSGARVEIGPVEGAFRPFADHEPVTAEIGGQGGAMIGYRVRVDGVVMSPDCLTVVATVTYDGMTPVESRRSVRMHCGQTLGLRDILPLCPGMPRIYPVSMSVEVVGVGTASATLDLMGGPCPRSL